MFSETRYTLNGDLRVAYRASAEGERDIVFVPNWFTCCEHLPELPSIQGWVEAMTSLGRLIFFDQPGSGASDPVEPGAMPTLEQWADSITAVLDALGSPGAALVTWPGAFPTAALFAATHPSRTTALIVLQAQDPHSGRPNGAAVLAVERRSRPGRCKGIGGQRDRSATSSIDRANALSAMHAAWWRSFRAASSWQSSRPPLASPHWRRTVAATPAAVHNHPR